MDMPSWTRRGLAVVVLLAGARAGSAESGRCTATAVVEGEGELAAELTYELAIVGAGRVAQADCPAVRVRAERSADGGILLVMTDQYGRSATRTVGSTASAATVVVSWASQGLASEAAPTIAAADGADGEPLPAMGLPGSTSSPAVTNGGLGVRLESAFDSHGQLWWGAGVAGCVQVGRLCAGGLARYGVSDVLSRELSEYPVHSGGGGMDLLATVSLPLQAGPFVVSPGLRAGYGQLAFSWSYDPNLPVIDDTQLRGVRFGGSLAASRRVGRGYSLELGLSVEALPGKYLRYDDALPPVRRFDYNVTVRGSLGLRHGG